MLTIAEASDASNIALRKMEAATRAMNEAADVEADLKQELIVARAKALDVYLGKTSVAEAERRADCAVAEIEAALVKATKDKKAAAALREVWQERVWSFRKTMDGIVEEMRMV